MANNNNNNNIEDFSTPPVYPPYDADAYERKREPVDMLQLINKELQKEGKPYLPRSAMQLVVNETVVPRKSILMLTQTGFYMIPETRYKIREQNRMHRFTTPRLCIPMLEKHDTSDFIFFLKNLQNDLVYLTKIGTNSFFVIITTTVPNEPFQQHVYIVDFERLSEHDQETNEACKYSVRILTKLMPGSNDPKKIPLPWGEGGPTWGKVIHAAVAMRSVDKRSTEDIVLFGSFPQFPDNNYNAGIVFDDTHVLNQASQFSVLELRNSYDILKTNATNELSIFDRPWIRKELLPMKLEQRLRYGPAVEKRYRSRAFMAVQAGRNKILIFGGIDPTRKFAMDTFFLDIVSNEISKGPSFDNTINYIYASCVLDNGDILVSSKNGRHFYMYMLACINNSCEGSEWKAFKLDTTVLLGKIDNFNYYADIEPRMIMQVNPTTIACVAYAFKTRIDSDEIVEGDFVSIIYLNIKTMDVVDTYDLVKNIKDNEPAFVGAVHDFAVI